MTKDWPELRLKYVCQVNPPLPRLPDDQEVTFVPMEAVNERGGLDTDQTRLAGAVRQGYTGFKNGDVVVAKITPCFENGKGSVVHGMLGGVGYGTTELHVLRSADCDREWLFYVTQSKHFMGHGEGAMYGAGGQKRVPPEFLRNYVTVTPPLPTQKAIADFLDRTTAAIDALIKKKQRLLALLAEKRSALINQAVTKGLDPQVPMKDSGIPWIGEIPAHWEVKRLKFLVTHIIDCHHSTPVYDEDAPYPALRTADISPGFLDVENARRVNATEFLHRIGRLRPRTHDIIYSREGERYGIAALVPDGAEVCLAQRVMLLRCAAVHDAGYVMWTLNADCTYQQMKQYVVGATSPHVNIGDIREAWLPVPPAVEQRQINGVITQALVFQRKLSERIERHIARLQEYRQALITAAVTGQLDIPQPEARG